MEGMVTSKKQLVAYNVNSDQLFSKPDKFPAAIESTCENQQSSPATEDSS